MSELKFGEELRFLHTFKVSPLLLITKRKKSNFTVEQPLDNTWSDQMNITINGTDWCAQLDRCIVKTMDVKDA